MPAVGIWLFTENDDFFGGRKRTQDPLGTVRFHVSYTARPGLWIAADATFYSGGRPYVSDLAKQDFQSNSRVGLTACFPIAKGHWVKVSGATRRHDPDRPGLQYDRARLPAHLARQTVGFESPPAVRGASGDTPAGPGR